MREYPSIDYDVIEDPDEDVYVFDKRDGRQIRGEWRADKDGHGFWKWGTKERLLRPEEPILHKAPEMVRERYGSSLDDIFRDAGYQRVTCFFEFYGPDSYKGRLDPAGDHEVELFDIWPDYTDGIVPPMSFLHLVGDLPHPECLYRGRQMDELVEAVREGSLVGMGPEGIVAKMPSPEDEPHPRMFKMKRQSWHDRDD